MILKVNEEYSYALECLEHFCKEKKGIYSMNLTPKSWFGVYEEYTFRVKNYMTVTLALSQVDSDVLLHVVIGGAGSGIFNISYGAENSRYKNVLEVLKKYSVDFELIE